MLSDVQGETIIAMLDQGPMRIREVSARTGLPPSVVLDFAHSYPRILVSKGTMLRTENFLLVMRPNVYGPTGVSFEFNCELLRTFDSVNQMAFDSARIIEALGTHPHDRAFDPDAVKAINWIAKEINDEFKRRLRIDLTKGENA